MVYLGQILFDFDEIGPLAMLRNLPLNQRQMLSVPQIENKLSSDWMIAVNTHTKTKYLMSLTFAFSQYLTCVHIIYSTRLYQQYTQ